MKTCQFPPKAFLFLSLFIFWRRVGFPEGREGERGAGDHKGVLQNKLFNSVLAYAREIYDFKRARHYQSVLTAFLIC